MGTVVGKAISLRQFGRTADAVAAFESYRKLFSKDPTADQYGSTAKKFTIALKRLKLKGGLYLFGVAKGKSLAKAGIKVGDIVIKMDDFQIANMTDFTNFMKSYLPNNPVDITFLRLNQDGFFDEREVTIEKLDNGGGFMPI